jgi:hypothetical protein
MKNDYENESSDLHKSICLLEKHLAFGACKKIEIIKIGVVGNRNG